MNRLFMWYLQEGGEGGVVHNTSKALRYAELCNEYLAPRRFEVLRVTKAEVLPKSDGQFLGFDLSRGYNSSLLSWGLKAKQPLDGEDAVNVLWHVVCAFFAPQLNEHGLFLEIDTALFCLKSMRALQTLKPNFFEGDDLGTFEVVGVHLIASDGQASG